MLKIFEWLKERPTLTFAGLILVLSYFTYFHNYYYPPNLFWDENYHIASAQKYLNGIYFMEPHPPLGKFLIALGEKILGMNPVNDQFIGTDYGRTLPEGFSFAGYRLFPTLLAWLTAPVIFGIFLLLTRNHLFASLFSFLYIFDNAIIVHQRSAMLDAPQMFFIALTILIFLLLLKWRDHDQLFRRFSILFGVAFAGVMTTKINGLVLILLIPALIYKLKPRWRHIHVFLDLSLLGFLVVYVGVWYVHFALASTVNPNLPDKGYYQASDSYKEILDTGRTASPLAFPVMLRDALKFIPHYERGVPRLDLCKSDENGSPFFFWPLGARTINYRWETPNGQYYRYLYLQTNPIVWWSSFLAVLAAFGMLVLPFFFPLREKLRNRFLLTVFVGLYASYMVAIARLDRVMYLYHYFIPLLFSFFILALVFQEVQHIWRFTLDKNRKSLLLLVFAAFIFFSFQFYRPLTYYEPISDAQFKRRAILPLWELTCIKCDKESMLVVPRK